jgi:hypothetical protein
MEKTTEVNVNGKLLLVTWEPEQIDHIGDNVPFGAYTEHFVNIISVTDLDGNPVSPELYELAIRKI